MVIVNCAVSAEALALIVQLGNCAVEDVVMVIAARHMGLHLSNMELALANVVIDVATLSDLVAQHAVEGSARLEQASIRLGLTKLAADGSGRLSKTLIVRSQRELIVLHVPFGLGRAVSS